MTRADALHIKLLLWMILLTLAMLAAWFLTSQVTDTNYERRQIEGVDCIVAFGSRAAVSCNWVQP